jgi:hypothetical protein
MSTRSRDSIVAEFWQHVRTEELPDLTAGPRSKVLNARSLHGLLDPFLKGLQFTDEKVALLQAAALLYHDQHDPAHDIVADRTDVTSAFIHGILHRREPDYWNAKYWFRRCDMHPAYSILAANIKRWNGPGEPEAIRGLVLPGSFDPFAFVDACERQARSPRGSPEVETLRKIQQAEFEALVQSLLT